MRQFATFSSTYILFIIHLLSVFHMRLMILSTVSLLFYSREKFTPYTSVDKLKAFFTALLIDDFLSDSLSNKQIFNSS